MTEDDKNIIDLVKDKLSITVINKVDLPMSIDVAEIEEMIPSEKFVKVSALTNKGIEELKTAIYEAICNKTGFMDEGLIAASQRQRMILQEAYNSLARAIDAMNGKMPIEMVELDIRESWEKLGK